MPGDGWIRKQPFDIREGALCARMSDWEYMTDGPLSFKEPPGPELRARWDEAKEVCGHCPVLDACHAQRLQHHRGVWGGTDQYERHLERKRGWKGKRKARAEAEQEVPAPALLRPPVARPKADFPEGDPTAGDGWIRDHRGISPAFYEATTPDGVWMRMKVKNVSTRQTIKWLLVEDVDLRRRVQVEYAEYMNRPDGKRRHDKAA